MKRAETVTFGGGDLDRAAHFRGDPRAMEGLASDQKARFLPIWRGKPLVRDRAGPALRFLSRDHPVVAGAGDLTVFLGLAAGRPHFAVDLSGWEPDAVAADPASFFDTTKQQHPGLEPGEVFTELRGVMAGLTPLDAELAATAKAILGWHRSHRFCAACGAESVAAMAGWQRSCPACDTQHFPRTDPVVIMLVTHGNSVLLGRSSFWPEGMFSLLAGFLEPGETVEAAVRREVFEEAAIRVGPVEYLASQPWPYPASLMIGCRGEAQNRDITLDPKELEDALWVTREGVMDAFAGRNPDLKPARAGSIAHFLLRNWLADTME